MQILFQCSDSFEISSSVTFHCTQGQSLICNQDFYAGEEILTSEVNFDEGVWRAANAHFVSGPHFEESSSSLASHWADCYTKLSHVLFPEQQASELLISAGCLPCLYGVTPPFQRVSPQLGPLSALR